MLYDHARKDLLVHIEAGRKARAQAWTGWAKQMAAFLMGKSQSEAKAAAPRDPMAAEPNAQVSQQLAPHI